MSTTDNHTRPLVQDSTLAAPPFNWRAHLAVHPAAELFPLMSEAELKELAEDIKTNGLRAPIFGWASGGQSLLDGRNRLDAMALLGLLYETPDHHVGLKRWTGNQWSDRPGGRLEDKCEFTNFHDGDPYAIALSLNVHRRHLTNEQKRELVDKLIKANPEKSDRQIADQAKVGHPKVARRRKRLEEEGDVERRSTSIDTKGRKQPRAKEAKTSAAPSVPQSAVDEIINHAEASAAARRAKYAAEEQQINAVCRNADFSTPDEAEAATSEIPQVTETTDGKTRPARRPVTKITPKVAKREQLAVAGGLDSTVFVDAPLPEQRKYLDAIGAKALLTALPPSWLDAVRAWLATHDVRPVLTAPASNSDDLNIPPYLRREPPRRLN